MQRVLSTDAESVPCFEFCVLGNLACCRLGSWLAIYHVYTYLDVHAAVAAARSSLLRQKTIPAGKNHHTTYCCRTFKSTRRRKSDVWWRQACRDVCVCVGQVCSTKTHTHRGAAWGGGGGRPRPFRTLGCGGTRLVDQHQAKNRAEL